MTDEKFDLPTWLTDDDYASKTFPVYLSPKTTEYTDARESFSIAKGEFDEVTESIAKGEDAPGDMSLGDIDPRQKRLEELHAEMEESIATIERLRGEVEATRKDVVVTDSVTLRELAQINREYTDKDGVLDEEGQFLELLHRHATVDGRKLPVEGWEKLSAKLRLGQWSVLQNDVMEFVGRSGVTPDFSPTPSLPNRE